MTLRILLYCACAYLLIAALMFLFQRKLLYLPTHSTPTDTSLFQHGVGHWPARQDYRGYLTEPDFGAVKGTVLIFHGNAGNAADRLYYSQALAPLGYRVLLVEYPGYGARPGSPSEENIVAEARESLNLLREQFGGPIILWGESLGSGVVASIVADGQMTVDSVVLLTPWDSLSNLAQSIYWFLPVRWMLRDHYDSIVNLQTFKGKVALITAGNDKVIPNAHSERLYDSLTTEKQRWHFKNADHNSWPASPGESWWKEVMLYLES